MRTRRWLRAAIVAATAAIAVAVALRTRRPAELGELRVTPPAARLSVRVGEAVHFSADADGASGVTWTVWGRPVSFDRSWVYVPAPEETGWQHVAVEVAGAGGARRTYGWDVGVVPAIAPELVEVVPPEGSVTGRQGESARFRAGARVPAARAGDRLRFEWTVDGRGVQRDELPADAATSELVLAAADPGTHRIAVHVTEDGKVASVAEWTLEVPVPEGAALAMREEPAGEPAPPLAETGAPVPEPPPAAVEPAPPVAAETPGPELPPETVPELTAPELALRAAPPAEEQPVPPAPPAAAPAPEAPAPVPPTAAPEPSAATVAVAKPPEPAAETAAVAKPPEPVPPPRLLRAPGPRQLASEPGDELALAIGVKPADASVSYEWSVDGRRMQETGPVLEYRPTRPGRHRVAVKVVAAGQRVGTDAWDVDVRAPEAEAEAEAAPRPVVSASTTTLPAVRVARATPPSTAPAPIAPAPPPRLAESEVRRWLQEYASAWTRKDTAALRRMGQIRSAAEAEQLERYFRSVQALEVDVRVVSLTVDGDRASVELERIDTVTDPAGRRQALRLPPLRKQIERTPDGLRFAAQR